MANEKGGFFDREPQTITDPRLREIIEQSPPPNTLLDSYLTPVKQVNVTSTYDARPIQSQDFFRAGGTLVLSGDQLTETSIFSFVVPAGRVAVVRFCYWEFDPIYAPNTIVSVLNYITLDGARLKFYDDIQNLQTTGIQGIGTFFIANQGQTVAINSIRVSNITVAARNVGLLVPFDPAYQAYFTGNMLLSRNLPPEFEIGSETR